MKIQVNWFPIALFSKTAATDESTPPDKPKITLSDLTSDLIFSIAESMNELEVHVALIFAIFFKKFSKINLPSSLW